jgi:hypothetical protein
VCFVELVPFRKLPASITQLPHSAHDAADSCNQLCLPTTLNELIESLAASGGKIKAEPINPLKNLKSWLKGKPHAANQTVIRHSTPHRF